MVNALLISLTLFAALVVTAYFYISHVYSYWKRKNMPYLKPTFPFGSFKKSILQKISFGELSEELHNSGTEPIVGFYAALQPSLLVRDPEIIRNILIKEFPSFNHRGLYSNEEVDPLTGSLLFLKDYERWKNLRSKLSPAFTSGKLKAMFPTLVECGDSLQKYVAEVADAGELLEVRDICARYATNVIASVAFGIEIDCIREPESEFRRYGKKTFEMSVSNGIRSALSFINPALMKKLRIRSMDKGVQEFFTAITKETLEYREKNNVVRKDFFQLLLQLRDSGSITQNDDEWHTNINEKNSSNKKPSKFLTLNELAAQSFIFFSAGFETSSTTMSFCLYELARAQDVQRKAHKEIDAILSKHNGQLTYDVMNEMKYLECCIDETLRRRPPLMMLPRECTKEFQLQNPNVIIEPGTGIMISVLALHHDPKYWNDPYKFDPDRFNEANSSGKSFIERPYLPFGEGPRNCIGLRLGKMQVKVGLVIMLEKFRFELADEHIGTELKYSPSSIISAPANGIRLKVFHR